jgi:hypothetical protein
VRRRVLIVFVPLIADLATISVPNGPVAHAAGAGALWIAITLDSTVCWIDPASGAIVSTIPVDSGPVALAYARGCVWVGVNTRAPS